MPNKMKAYFKRDENAFQTLHDEFVNGFARQLRRVRGTTLERWHDPPANAGREDAAARH